MRPAPLPSRRFLRLTPRLASTARSGFRSISPVQEPPGQHHPAPDAVPPCHRLIRRLPGHGRPEIDARRSGGLMIAGAVSGLDRLDLVAHGHGHRVARVLVVEMEKRRVLAAPVGEDGLAEPASRVGNDHFQIRTRRAVGRPDRSGDDEPMIHLVGRPRRARSHHPGARHHQHGHPPHPPPRPPLSLRSIFRRQNLYPSPNTNREITAPGAEGGRMVLQRFF